MKSMKRKGGFCGHTSLLNLVGAVVRAEALILFITIYQGHSCSFRSLNIVKSTDVRKQSIKKKKKIPSREKLNACVCYRTGHFVD